MGRIQNLIGYQLINKTNISGASILDANKILNWIDPITEEPLTVPAQVLPSETSERVTATVDDIKRLVNSCMSVINTESGAVFEFLNRYSTVNDIDAGLQQFAVTKTQVDSDINMSLTTKDNLSVSLAIETRKNKIKFLAETFKDWIPEVKRVVHAHELNQDEQMINIFQDLFNALAFELQGKNSYTGELHGLNFEQLKKQTESRLRTSNRIWIRTPQTVETEEYKVVLDALNNEFPKVVDLNGCKVLGAYIDSNVPKLPLVRRWWQYGS